MHLTLRAASSGIFNNLIYGPTHGSIQLISIRLPCRMRDVLEIPTFLSHASYTSFRPILYKHTQP